MDVPQAIALKDQLTAAIAAVIEETGANTHEVQVRVTCVHDTGQLLMYDVLLP